MVEPAMRELGGIIVNAFQATKEGIVFKVELTMISKGMNCLQHLNLFFNGYIILAYSLLIPLRFYCFLYK